MTALLLIPSKFIGLTSNSTKHITFRRQMMQKILGDNLLIFCAIYKAHNADNARTLGI